MGKENIFFHRESADNSETIFRVNSYGRMSRVWKVILFVVSHSNVYAWRYHHLYSDNERRTSNIKSVKCSRTLKLMWTLHPSLSDMPQNSLEGVFAQWVQLYIYAEFHTNCQKVNRERKRTMWRRKNLNIWNFPGSYTIKWMEPLRRVIFISAS